MKTSIVFGSLMVCLASMGMAQAAESPAVGTTIQIASAGHDPYYPMVSQAPSESRAEVLKELKGAQMNIDLMQPGHNAYYPDQLVK